MSNGSNTRLERLEPFAFSLLRRFRAGETVADLAAAEGIPAERIAMRVRGAELCERMRAGGEPGRVDFHGAASDRSVGV